MDIDLSDLTRPGRVAEPTLDARDITPGDLDVLRESRAADIPPRKRLRHKHHSLARALAGGMSPGQAAIVAGFAPVTVSILQSDPAFRDLVDFYAADVAKTFDRLAEQQVRVVAVLLDSMEDDVKDPEKLGKMTFAAKRDTALALGLGASVGAVPAKQTEVHVHANFATILQRARERAPAASPQRPHEAVTLHGHGEQLQIEGTFEVIDGSS